MTAEAQYRSPLSSFGMSLPTEHVSEESPESYQTAKDSSSQTPEPPSLKLATPSPSLATTPNDSAFQPERYGLPANPNPVDNGPKPTLQQRLRSIITTEFDLEIQLKAQEVHAIDDEIAKIHSMMTQIKTACEQNSAQVTSNMNTIPEFTEYYAQFLDVKPQAKKSNTSNTLYPTNGDDTIGKEGDPGSRKRHYSFNHHNSSVPTKILRSHSFTPTSGERLNRLRRPTNDSDGQRGSLMKPKCIVRRNDGLLVRLVCPKCLRDNFGSAQGFINHCRISHALELTTHDAAAVTCGVEVEEQDEIGSNARCRIKEGLPPLKVEETATPAKPAKSKSLSRGKRGSRGQADAKKVTVARGKLDSQSGSKPVGKTGGKYRPGFAPSHWSALPNSEGGEVITGKTLPGTMAATLSKQSGRVIEKNRNAKTSTVLGRITSATVLDSDQDDDSGSEDDGEDDDDDDDDDDDEDDEDEDDDDDDDDEVSEVEKSTSIKQRFGNRPGSSSKTLPGTRGSFPTGPPKPVDNLKKFMPYSRFF